MKTIAIFTSALLQKISQLSYFYPTKQNKILPVDLWAGSFWVL